MASLEIPLPELDVWVRLCETLLRDSAQIPISMSRDCRFFSVIRTIYHVTNDDGKFSYTSCSLPRDCILQGFSSGKDPADLTFEDFNRYKNDDLKHVLLYWIYFDDCGQSLCYATQERSSPVLLRLFNLMISRGDRLQMKAAQFAERRFWTRDIGRPYGYRDEKEFEMCFHPYLPVVVHAWERATYAWNFNTGKEGPNP